MENCRWLLCLVLIIGLSAREVISIDDQPRGKNDSKKLRESDEAVSPSSMNSEEKRKSRSSYDPDGKESDQVPLASAATVAPGVAAMLQTSFNGTTGLVPDAGAAAAKPGSHDQSTHSKRHFRRSKVYRKETTSKSRTSLTKSNMDLFRSSNRPNTTDNDPSKPRSSSASRNDSIPTTSSKSIAINGSRNLYKRNADKLSSRMTASSGWFEDWYNLSSSSSASSVIDEKSSSMELMTFTFDSVEEIRRTTLPNEIEKRTDNLTVSKSSTVENRSSAIMAMVQTSDQSISVSTTADLNSSRIDRDQSVQTSTTTNLSNDFIVSSANGVSNQEVVVRSHDLQTTSARKDVDKLSKNSVSVGNDQLSASTNYSNRSAKMSSAVSRSENESTVMNFPKSSNQTPSAASGSEYSWVSYNVSTTRVSLTEVADTLKHINPRQAQDLHYYSNSTLSRLTNASLQPNVDIGANVAALSAKHSRSLTPIPAQIPTDLSSSVTGDPDLGLSEGIDHPLKLIIPLNLEPFSDTRTTNNITLRNDEDLQRSTSLSWKRAVQENASSSLTPSSQCSSSFSANRSQNVRRIEYENPFHQRRGEDVTLSVSPGSDAPSLDQCLTRRSSDDGLIESPIPQVVPSGNPETPTALNQSRGPQSSRLSTSGLIVPESFEAVIRESLRSAEEVTVTVEDGDLFGAFAADLDEHCNASSFNVFIPFVNSRETVAKVLSNTEDTKTTRSETQQNLTTEDNDSLYIMEGFGFLKNNADDVSEAEDEVERKRDLAFDYTETEKYPGYLQVEDRPAAFKAIDQIEFEADFPAKRDTLASGLQWRGNFGERREDPWWLRVETKSKMKRADTSGGRESEKESAGDILSSTKVSASQSLAKTVVSSPKTDDSQENVKRTSMLPMAYVLIGMMCVIVVGCGIWCRKLPVKKQAELPKMTYFIQRPQEITEAVV